MALSLAEIDSSLKPNHHKLGQILETNGINSKMCLKTSLILLPEVFPEQASLDMSQWPQASIPPT